MQTTKLENGQKLEPKVHLLLSREESSMVSTKMNKEIGFQWLLTQFSTRSPA